MNPILNTSDLSSKPPPVRRCAILSANFGGYDREEPWPSQRPLVRARPSFPGRAPWGPGPVEEQVVFSAERFNDSNFPGRELALTPRLKPALIKMFGWEFVTNHHYYIWVDSSKTITSDAFGCWMLEQLGTAELAVFRHPERGSIREEWEFVRRKLDEGSRYLLSRYQGEYLDAQWSAIYRDRTYLDDTLYASTAFAYRPLRRVRAAMKEWWFHKTRYLLHDQLALPYVLRQHGVRVQVIDADIYKLPLWRHNRPSGRRRAGR